MCSSSHKLGYPNSEFSNSAHNFATDTNSINTKLLLFPTSCSSDGADRAYRAKNRTVSLSVLHCLCTALAPPLHRSRSVSAQSAYNCSLPVLTMSFQFAYNREHLKQREHNSADGNEFNLHFFTLKRDTM